MEESITFGDFSVGRGFGISPRFFGFLRIFMFLFSRAFFLTKLSPSELGLLQSGLRSPECLDALKWKFWEGWEYTHRVVMDGDTERSGKFQPQRSHVVSGVDCLSSEGNKIWIIKIASCLFPQVAGRITRKVHRRAGRCAVVQLDPVVRTFRLSWLKRYFQPGRLRSGLETCIAAASLTRIHKPHFASVSIVMNGRFEKSDEIFVMYALQSIREF